MVYSLFFPETKQDFKFIRAIKTVLADPNSEVQIIKTRGQASTMSLVAKSYIDGLLSTLDPVKTLLPLVSYLPYFEVSAGQRIEELYYLVNGLSLSPGTDPNPLYWDKSGLEKKIKLEGRVIADRAENLTVMGGMVNTTYPIQDPTEVAAFLINGTPVVVGAIAAPQLGGVPVTAPNGTTIVVNYPTVEHCVINLQNTKHIAEAAIVSQELLDYLRTNQ